MTPSGYIVILKWNGHDDTPECLESAEKLGHSACWAEPDIDDAANWMKTLYSKPDMRKISKNRYPSAVKTGSNDQMDR